MKVEKNLIVYIGSLFFIQLYSNRDVIRFYSDYSLHGKIAESMASSGNLEVPHFLYHVLMIGISFFPGFDLNMAGYYIIPIFSYISLAIVSYNYVFEKKMREISFGIKQKNYAFLLIIVLLIVGPVSLFTWPNLYLGYIGINVYHNPTVTLAKPLSIALFWMVLETLKPCNHDKEKLFFIRLFTLTTASLFAKPSYIICLVPALIIYIFFDLTNKQHTKKFNIVSGVFIPAVLVLSWQYRWAYGSNSIMREDSKVIWAPLAVMSYFSDISPSALELSVGLRLILSTLFPLSVYILNWRNANKNIDLNLAWLTFLISAVYSYFLAESGARMYHGNFTWSSQICLFILFLASAKFLLTQGMRKSVSFVTCCSTFGLHAISGVLFFLSPNSW
jgi:hypothetical protein